MIRRYILFLSLFFLLGCFGRSNKDSPISRVKPLPSLSAAQFFTGQIQEQESLTEEMALGIAQRKPASRYDYYQHYVRAISPQSGCLRDLSFCNVANECCSYLCKDSFCVPRVPPIDPNTRQSCTDIGASCTLGAQCCSKNCSGNICMGEANSYCGYVGQYCNRNDQCCSGLCDGEKCTGVEKIECGIVGSTCELSIPSQCCSGRCYSFNQSQKGQCIGGNKDLGRSGELCISNKDCMSQSCEQNSTNQFGVCR